MWTNWTDVRLDWRDWQWVADDTGKRPVPRGWWLLGALLVSLSMWAVIIWAVVALVF
ncbi:hypothetical protein [Mongoliimonas terrestris]|uniref:hypothetical protein n=1 Tax=Mongoliimonas terrestris TaxID=1709001 RepID=UPI000A5A0ABC|nr:hypothetical protein [Mongoliimonas terrestris]